MQAWTSRKHITETTWEVVSVCWCTKRPAPPPLYKIGCIHIANDWMLDSNPTCVSVLLPEQQVFGPMSDRVLASLTRVRYWKFVGTVGMLPAMFWLMMERLLAFPEESQLTPVQPTQSSLSWLTSHELRSEELPKAIFNCWRVVRSTPAEAVTKDWKQRGVGEHGYEFNSEWFVLHSKTLQLKGFWCVGCVGDDQCAVTTSNHLKLAIIMYQQRACFVLAGQLIDSITA